jgi:hypothetical protein
MARRQVKKAAPKADVQKQRKQAEPAPKRRRKPVRKTLSKRAMSRIREDIEAAQDKLDERGLDVTAKEDKYATRARKLHILALMTQGAPPSQIVSYCRKQLGMFESDVRITIGEIREQWRRDHDEMMRYARAEAVHRIRSDLTKMRARDQSTPGYWRDIRNHEQMLAQIEGTLQPIKVQVLDVDDEMRDAMTRVLGGMDAEAMKNVIDTEGYGVTQFAPPALADAAE